ncbi:MAG: Endo-polygalacturonase [Candidatus Ordinivivax streblomastigis]|uniref:Endo-polygalacturonase n=1 Tax=Candidatus Ordinivivax streblomastigis TaxID=2540710 RepID=A0A5M8NTY9_9BACT|nr:MAG: Endo-polygalacturonase [Candidatus Ordinivivax streblomastigis]
MLIGSQNLDDYLKIDTRIAGIEMEWPSALINIIDSKNAAISGDGVINGRGKVFWDKFREMNKEYNTKALRWAVDYDCQCPRGILIANCSDVTVKDIILYQPGFWSVHILYSHHVTVDNVIISNNIEGRGPSTDGIDIDSSEKVLVQNSNINCNDDNFCLKAGRDADGLRVNRPCQYVVIRDCIAGHGDGLFTCGSETSGGIKHIVAYNLKGLGTHFGLRFKSTSLRGGIMEDIHFYNIEMTDVKNPLILDLNWFPSYSFPVLPEGYHPDSIPAHWKILLLPVDPEKGLPKFRNIYFENVSATNAEKCVAVYGLANSLIEQFHFKNVRLQGEKAGNINYAENWHFDGFVIDAKNSELEMKNNKNVNPREAEQQQENAKKDALKREQQAAEDISNYLSALYPAQVSEVTPGQNKITVYGIYSGKGSYSLCEITPWQDVTRTTVFAYKTPLTSSPFNLDFDRFVVREGVTYDRTLSKWMIVKNGKSKDEIVSHARYADHIYSVQTLKQGTLASKKGLGGSNAQKQQDFDDLQIKSTTVNIWIGRLIYSSAGANRIAHQYGGRTWYFDRTQTETLDKNMQFCAQRNIVVAAIVLVDKASNCPDTGKLLQHPDLTKGNYSMPNMTTPEATLIYAAALDFLAARYCRSDNQYGRIHHWIMHNEVDDSGWTNMGDNRAMMVYMDTYVKSMRLCYNIARQYDSHAEVFGSFTHSWAAAKGTNYAARDMLDALNLYSKVEGDFMWGLGYHPYPESIREPKTWLDVNAIYSTDTKMITFKNLEALDKWVK